eukprot:Em0013g686a
MTASPECDYPIVPSLPDAGPSGLCIQHLIDAVEVQLQTPILHSLRAIINILASGKTPTVLSAFLAGGNLTALNKSKAGGPFNVCPITVGEALPCLTGKWCCSMVKVKATDFFQFGVACSFGAEKIAEAHGLRARIEEHWAIAKDSCCPLLFHTWYQDDGALAGPRSSLCRVLTLILELGPPLGLHINISKCEVFRCKGFSSFPPEMKQSGEPNLDILDVPIDIADFCLAFIFRKHVAVNQLLSSLEEVGAVVPNVAFTILRIYRGSPPLPTTKADVHRGTSVDRSPKKSLSSKLDVHPFKVLLDVSSIADKARLLSVSSPHVASWLSVTPSEGLGLHLDPSQFQVAIKWWLGLEVSYGSCYPLCPEIALDPLGHPSKRDVMSLPSPVSELIWVFRWMSRWMSRWKWVAMSPPITATPIQLTFWFQTGSWASQQLLTSH